MTATPEQVAPHMARFLAMLDSAFRQFGVLEGLPARFRNAVEATPRHRFVHRFRLRGGPEARPEDNVLRDNDADPTAALADIYSDAVMAHVDAAGERLPSTNSQPSYVLWLLHLLDLQPGQRMLEIGSGSGWLAAVMARLVGKSGTVTGIEIIPELAAQSRIDLAALGLRNVTVLATDGARGHPEGAPFDRVMITAAVWDFPTMLFDQVAEGGLVLMPVELRGGGCQVSVFRRDGEAFVAERAVPGWFVPLVGAGQQRPRLRSALSELPFWNEIDHATPLRLPLPLATGPEGGGGSAVAAFRAFLGRMEPGFTVFGDGEPAEQRPWLPAEPFGIVDAAGRSVAVWSGGELTGYGGSGAMRSLARAYKRWASLGLPGLAGLGLQVVRGGAAPAGSKSTWFETRTETALVWQPLPDAEAWRSLLDETRPALKPHAQHDND